MKTNPVFETNYNDYLHRLAGVDFPVCAPVLDIAVDDAGRAVAVPFFNATYRVSRFGVVDDRGRRPDYGVCVVLLKYLLMCPPRIPPETDWVTPRDFRDAGRTQNEGLSAYAARAITKRYAGNLGRLQAAVAALGGRPPETDYPYDLAAVITALPRVPLLFLFNDTEETFAARTLILFERRAARFLDAECRVMVEWYLLEHLKRAERLAESGPE
jgi:hypothetical protein